MWPSLVYAGDGAQSIVNPQESLFSLAGLQRRRQDGHDRAQAVEVVGRHADHQPGLHLRLQPAEGELAELERLRPGLFPTDVASVPTPNAQHGRAEPDPVLQPGLLHRRRAQRRSRCCRSTPGTRRPRPGKVGNYDETAAGAKAVYAFLQKQGGRRARSPPTRCGRSSTGPGSCPPSAATATTATCRTRTTRDPTSRRCTRFNESYTSDTAELDALRSGSALTVGALPQNDIPQAGVLKAERLLASPTSRSPVWPTSSRTSTTPRSARSCAALRPPGHGGPDQPARRSSRRSTPATPTRATARCRSRAQQWASPLEKSGGPYPYSPSKAIAPAEGARLEGDAGRHLHLPASRHRRRPTAAPGSRPGSRWRSSCSTPPARPPATSRRPRSSRSEAQAGITINLKSEPFNSLICHRRHLQRRQPPGLDLRLAARGLRLRPVRPLPGG